MSEELKPCRSKTLEVIARAISIDLGEDPDALDVLIHDRPGTRPHWEGYESAAQAALAALQAEGMAVVDRPQELREEHG